MSRARYHMMAAAAGEFYSRRGAVRRGHDAVGVAVQRDGGHRNRRQRREPALQAGVLRISVGETEAVAIAMDDDIDVIRVVVGRDCPLQGRIIKMPVQRPLLL